MPKYEKWLSEDNLLRIEGWARDGLTDEQIAKKMGVNRDTIYTWKKRFPDISDALKKGREPLDIIIENALVKKAMGYRTTEVTRERMFNRETGRYELVTTKETEKDVPPDPTSIIFYLKNKKPKDYRASYENERLQNEKLRAEIEAIKIKMQLDSDSAADDGFLAALNGSAESDWEGEA